MSYKKWIGGGVGWVLGGPIGGLLGFAFGSLFDNVNLEALYAEIEAGKSTTQEGDFRISLLVLSAAVIKADGKILPSELNYVKQFLIGQFGIDKANESMRIFNQLNKKNISIEAVSKQIRVFMDYSSRLQLLHYLFGIAKVDGHVTDTELDMISRIAGFMGIQPRDFTSIKSMFYKSADNAYKILGVSKSDEIEVIKKTYRKLTLQYHPDKIGHLGEEVQKAAKEKYQKIIEAYEIIKNERGVH